MGNVQYARPEPRSAAEAAAATAPMVVTHELSRDYPMPGGVVLGATG